jgi:putative membrane protein
LSLHSVTRLLLILLAGATTVSVGGTFLLAYDPSIVALLGRSLHWFIKVPTLLYLTVIPLIALAWSFSRLGVSRSIALLLWGSAIGLGAELIGTTTGWPFGLYAYSDFLGLKVLGHVPLLVPLSWYAMSLLAVILASAVTTHRVGRVLLAACYMVCWDLALDPAMVAGWPVWVWSDPAAIYYGMPALNLVGWFLTASVIVSGFVRMVDVPRDSAPWATRVWLLSATLPLGLAAARQMWPALLVGSVAVALPVFLGWRANHRVATPGAIPAGQLP